MVGQRGEDSNSEVQSELISSACGSSDIKHHQLTNESIAHGTKLKIVRMLSF